MKVPSAIQKSRPDVFRFHDYRTFLRDWFAYQKQNQPGFTHRFLASQANIALGYLSVILSGKRHISWRAFSRLLPHLNLSPSEQAYLENLVKLPIAESQEDRLAAMSAMNSFGPYQRLNPAETKFIKYMSRWHHIAIRQLAGLPGFQLDPHWIQSRLKVRVPIQDLKEAIEFLIDGEYLKVREDGTVVPPEEHLNCSGEIYRTALIQYHKQMFMLAMLAIDNTPGTQRRLVGHTLSINPAQFQAADKILNEALEKIQALQEDIARNDDSVYHVQFAIFPLAMGGQSE